MNNSADKILKPYVLKPGESLNGSNDGLKASVASTGGSLTCIESHTMGGAPLHVHSREDEYFYVTAGTIVITCAGETFEAGEGSFAFLPKNIPHSWDVISEGGATVLMITVPAMLEVFLKEFHEAGSREDRETIAGKFGLRFL